MLPEQANHTEQMKTFTKPYILSSQYRYNLRSKMIHFKHTDTLRNLLISNT